MKIAVRGCMGYVGKYGLHRDACTHGSRMDGYNDGLRLVYSIRKQNKEAKPYKHRNKHNLNSTLTLTLLPLTAYWVRYILTVHVTSLAQGECKCQCFDVTLILTISITVTITITITIASHVIVITVIVPQTLIIP